MMRNVFALSLFIVSIAVANPPEGKKPTLSEARSAAPDRGESQLRLVGITFIVPTGWENQPIQAGGAMAPKAVYKIPATKPDDEAGMVRITHYPEMKGKDEQNIDRWIAQVSKADGQLAARTDAKIDKFEEGNIRVTWLDISGNVKMTMRDTGKPNHRMIAAIVDHPKGPHFVVAAGPVDSMKTWEADIMAFLKSAKVVER